MIVQSDVLPLSRLSSKEPGRWALFLDFDGTLADIVDHPDQVLLPPGTRTALLGLQRALGGAVAIVTGRSIADIDRVVDIAGLPVAGVHGLKRRDFNGIAHDALLADAALASARDRLSSLADTTTGTFVETKPGSLAFHYRARPDLAEHMPLTIAERLQGLDGLHSVAGKMVVEIKGANASKGDAVIAFMAEEPFAGRTPVFAGDDVTDEDAFKAVNALGGISIKVGPGPTSATYRAESPDAFRAWLGALAASFA